MRYFNIYYFTVWVLFIIATIYFRPIGLCGSRPYIDAEELMASCNVTPEELFDKLTENSSFCPQHRDYFDVAPICSGRDKTISLLKDVGVVSFIYNAFYLVLFVVFKYVIFKKRDS